MLSKSESLKHRDDEIKWYWQQGKQSIDIALIKLRSVRNAILNDHSVVDNIDELDAFIHKLERGILTEFSYSGNKLFSMNGIDLDLKNAITIRNQLIELAKRTYGSRLKRIAQFYHRALDHENDIARAWEQVIRNFYTWKQQGTFHSWISTIVRNSLREGIRTSDRHTQKLHNYLQEQSCSLADKGTTTLGTELVLESFKNSLEPEKRRLWDQWEQLGTRGFKPEQIYQTLAKQYGKSSVAIKGILLRMQADFKELASANATGVVDASTVIAMWVGSERRGHETAIVATGIDVQDHAKLLAIRRVRHVNHRAFIRLFETLQRWGLAKDHPLLAVVDDSEGLNAAVADFFMDKVILQPCLCCFIRAVTDILPKKEQALYEQRIAQAYKFRTTEKAQNHLEHLICELEQNYPQAAAKLREGFEASLTVKRFGLPESLEQELSHVQFMVDSQPQTPFPFSWLSGLFMRLRERRSVERRKQGLEKLITQLLQDVSKS